MQRSLPEGQPVLTLPCAFFLGYTWCIDLLDDMTTNMTKEVYLKKDYGEKNYHSMSIRIKTNKKQCENPVFTFLQSG